MRRGDPALVPARRQHLVEWRRRRGEALDHESGVGDEGGERARREEVEVGPVENAAVDVVEAAAEKQEPDVEMGDVRHRDDHETLRRERSEERRVGKECRAGWSW